MQHRIADDVDLDRRLAAAQREPGLDGAAVQPALGRADRVVESEVAVRQGRDGGALVGQRPLGLRVEGHGVSQAHRIDENGYELALLVCVDKIVGAAVAHLEADIEDVAHGVQLGLADGVERRKPGPLPVEGIDVGG